MVKPDGLEALTAKDLQRASQVRHPGPPVPSSGLTYIRE